jgi:Bacterial Ig-like domain (group 3)/IPT/TIG domain
VYAHIFSPRAFRRVYSARGDQIDDQIELCGLLDRNVGGFRPAQNLVHIVGGAAVQVTAGAAAWQLKSGNDTLLDTAMSSTTRLYAVTGANNDTTLKQTIATPAAVLSFSASCTPAPTVTNVNPNSGPAAGGTSVTITGTNFTGTTAIKFGSANATSVTVNSATSITATSPHGTGTVDVTVTTPNGTSATTAADRFTYVTANTTVTLTSSQNPSQSDQPATFTATVTGVSPTGTVTFKNGGTVLGTATLNASRPATLTTSSLSVGTHSITATYDGDANNSPSTSTALLQTVNVRRPR